MAEETRILQLVWVIVNVTFSVYVSLVCNVQHHNYLDFTRKIFPLTNFEITPIKVFICRYHKNSREYLNLSKLCQFF